MVGWIDGYLIVVLGSGNRFSGLQGKLSMILLPFIIDTN